MLSLSFLGAVEHCSQVYSFTIFCSLVLVRAGKAPKSPRFATTCRYFACLLPSVNAALLPQQQMSLLSVTRSITSEGGRVAKEPGKGADEVGFVTGLQLLTNWYARGTQSANVPT